MEKRSQCQSLSEPFFRFFFEPFPLCGFSLRFHTWHDWDEGKAGKWQETEERQTVIKILVYILENESITALYWRVFTSICFFPAVRFRISCWSQSESVPMFVYRVEKGKKSMFFCLDLFWFYSLTLCPLLYANESKNFWPPTRTTRSAHLWSQLTLRIFPIRHAWPNQLNQSNDRPKFQSFNLPDNATTMDIATMDWKLNIQSGLCSLFWPPT